MQTDSGGAARELIATSIEVLSRDVDAEHVGNAGGKGLEPGDEQIAHPTAGLDQGARSESARGHDPGNPLGQAGRGLKITELGLCSAFHVMLTACW